jgi:hypothetical protein
VRLSRIEREKMIQVSRKNVILISLVAQ